MRGFDGEAITIAYLNTVLPSVQEVVSVDTKKLKLTYVDGEGEIKNYNITYDPNNIRSEKNIIYHITTGGFSKLNYWYVSKLKDPMLKHIANRSPHLVEYLELSLGIDLPEDAEVWSKLPLEKYIN